jgi:exodeoxyribonuclease-3
MRIISYNVNGIRAAFNKGFIEWLKQADPDIICLQETKAMQDQVAVHEIEEAGYPHHYWFSAEKKGYSGVAILSKHKPENVVYGTGIDTMDSEGRNLRLDFKDFSVMSLYLPSGTNTARHEFKFSYMEQFYDYINELKQEVPNLVICGDYNIAHERIDIHDPVRLSRVSGFLPNEREWLTKFMNNGFIDTFRHFNKDPHHYTWWSNFGNARANNKGWRIDYALATETMKDRLKRAVILKEAKHSDHCPLLLEIE